MNEPTDIQTGKQKDGQSQIELKYRLKSKETYTSKFDLDLGKNCFNKCLILSYKFSFSV